MRYLLIPYDGGETVNSLVEQVKRLAQKQSGQFLESCRLCWVNDTPTQAERETLAQVKADLESANLQVEANFHQGTALAEVLEVAQMDEISAIAITSGTLGTFQEWFVSSFAAELMRQSWCPVLFFPKDCLQQG